MEVLPTKGPCFWERIVQLHGNSQCALQFLAVTYVAGYYSIYTINLRYHVTGCSGLLVATLGSTDPVNSPPETVY